MAKGYKVLYIHVSAVGSFVVAVSHWLLVSHDQAL